MTRGRIRDLDHTRKNPRPQPVTTIEEALEGSTPLAKKVRAAGPYRSGAQLIAQMRATLPTLTDEEKVTTLNAHPRIGEDRERLSTRSLKEQGTDQLPADRLPELRQLNVEYERRFGFRFVVFVNRRPKTDIVKVLQARLRRTREEELQEGLRAIVAIAEDRLRS
jgi:2-oxo-4-hydroxy-4-carboxy--5-ureidoimidazoline (OHCU) decarboxylase